MELPNRATLESQLARRLERLNAQQRRRIRAIIGNPPRWELLSEAFWQQLERESEQETLAAFYLLFLASASFHAAESGATRDAALLSRLRTDAEAYAGRRAKDYARRRTAAARKSLDRLAERLRRAAAQQAAKELKQPVGAGPVEAFKIDQAKLDEELAKTIGPKKAAMDAGNEMTAAQNAGGDAGVEATVGISALDQWDVHPELSRGGVCGNCQRLAGVIRANWATMPLDDPDGHTFDVVEPGNAAGCNCTTKYANIPDKSKEN